MTYNSVERDGQTRTQGGYSDKIVVDENYILQLPENIGLDRAAPLLCAGITMYSPLMHWRAGPGSIIDELISMTAPLTVGKKALLIVAVNAGLPNDPTRLPKRIRSHVGLIGDPGQAKTQLLYQIVDLVPGSRVESMQSGTPISMTVFFLNRSNDDFEYVEDSNGNSS